jgi:hypothetical protein
MSRTSIFSAAALAMIATVASAQQSVVFQSTNNSGGFFTPFDPTNANGLTYGDGGWLGQGGGSPPFILTQLTLGLCTFGSETDGSTDLTITLNDGDPSGMVFGTGQTFYSVTIPDVFLPRAVSNEPTYFDLTIPLPNVRTRGNFNNIGFSIRPSNYNFAGQFGFQTSDGNGQAVGFYTNNASFRPANGNWGLFAFGQDPVLDVANYVATVVGEQRATCGADVGSQGGLVGPDGALDNNDFAAFITMFFEQNPLADMGIQGGLLGSDGLYDNNDFAAFITEFFTPCAG